MATLKAALRVNQLDAQMLDDDIIGMLGELATPAFDFMPYGSLRRFHPTIKMIAKFMIWWFTVRQNLPLPGSKVQNVRHHGPCQPKLERAEFDQRLKLYSRYMFGFLTIILPWMVNELKIRLENRSDSLSQHEADRWLMIIRRLEALVDLFSFVNFLLFLKSGKQRNIVDKLLGLEMFEIDANASRQMSFEYMQHQLYWNTTTEMLLTVIPLINIHKVHSSSVRWVKTVIAARKDGLLGDAAQKIGYMFDEMRSFVAARLGRESPKDNDQVYREEIFAETVKRRLLENRLQDAWLDSGASCNSCGIQPISNPIKLIPCGHLVCYWCHASHASQSKLWYGKDSAITCPECNDVVKIEDFFYFTKRDRTGAIIGRKK